MTDLPRDVKRHLAESKHPLGIKELLKLTHLHPGQQTQLKRTLRDLVRTGELLKEGKRFRLRSGRPAPNGGGGEGRASPPQLRRGREEQGPDGWRGRKQEERAPGAWREGSRDERRPGGPREEARSEPDARFAPRGRFSKEERPEPRGRFVREGRVEPRNRFARDERGGPPSPGPSEQRGPELRGRFARDERGGPGQRGRFEPRGPQGGHGRQEKPGGGRFEQAGRFEPRGRSARDERGGPGKRGGRFEQERRPGRGGRFEREGRFEPRGRGQETTTIEGILHVHRDGYGFVHPSSGEGDNIFLPPHEAARALDNDRVLVEAWGRPGRMEGRLLQVVGRTRQLAVGTYVERGKRQALVIPYDKNLQTQGHIRVPPTQMARDGDVVKVRLGIGAELLEPGEGLYGEVAGSIGKPGDPSNEVLSIAYSQGFSDEFPPEVMDEADRIRPVVSEEEARGEDRRDLRQLPLVTIDGEDARDFDDAVYAESHPQGWRLVVAIADVTHYVREGTALDAEALRRATSVYLPDRVLPMLPERLSNGICSLRPDEDRLCMVADMVLDRSGRLVSSEIYPGVMRSHARCTYNEVQDVLDGKDVPHRNAFKPHFERLMELARVLMRMRKERGSIDFNLPEHKVVMGENGMPARMERRERKDSHRLIEECMLAANEAVAKFFADLGLPSVYRYHGEPDDEKLAVFAQLAQAYGFRLQAEEISPQQLNAFMAQLQGHPEERALNQLLLRSMMQAVYTASDIGHYGLAAEYYLHFTSPIRRYPDLLVHRLLKAHWARNGQERSPAQLEREEQRLEDMASQCSERERAAMQVEREVVSYYAALMMKDRLGEEFAATVAGLVEFGFFVELDEVHVEGLVRADSLGVGTRFDKNLHSFTLPGGFRVRVGQKARVRLVNVNLALRRIEFEALEVAGRAVAAIQEVDRVEREAQQEQARQERKKAARAAREQAREERWGRPPEQAGLSMAEAEALRRREAEEAAAARAPAAQGAPPTVERQTESVEIVERFTPTAPAGFDRIRALAALDAREEPAETGTAAEEKPARAKRAAAGARKKAAPRAAMKKTAAGGAGAKKKAPATRKAPAAKKAPARKAAAKKAPSRKAAAKKTARAPAAKKAPATKKQASAAKVRTVSKARSAAGARAKGGAKKAASSRKAKKR